MSGGVKAFEGAEGFGANTVGGRGGQVLHVTNLNDDGYGSLRWALEMVKGPRTIVFDVNGTITLTRQILIEDGFVTIAGQTAPGNGIVIEGSRIRVDASEVIIRGLTFRPGDGPIGMKPDDRDGLFIGSTDNVVKNVIVDHNSFEWAIDQNLAATGRVEFITFSNNIIAQGLQDSLHSKGPHSKGAGTGPWTTGEWNANNHITFVKNLLAGNHARNPEIGGGDKIELINNYIFNYGMGHLATALGTSNKVDKLDLNVNVIGNVYEAGLDTPASSKGPIWLGNLNSASNIFLSDNLVAHRAVDAGGNQAQATLYWSGFGGTGFVKDQAFFAGSGTAILDSQQVAAYVLANAGARPYARDAVDARIIAGVADKSLRIVDSVAEAGGKAPNPPVAAAADTDRDGMPDWFETKYGFNPNAADDKGDNDGDGYTNLEEYLNGLFTGFDVGPTVAGYQPPVQAPTPPGPPPLPFYTADGQPITYRQGTAGNDTFAIRSVNERVLEEAGGGTDLVVAYADHILDEHVENLSLKAGATKGIGNELANQITGDVGAETLDGKGGDDRLKGQGGHDQLFGGAGNDWLEGNDGDDRLSGGAGADVMLGGAGSDTFILESGGSIATPLAAGDRIGDFAAGDRIVVDGKTLDLKALPVSKVTAASYAGAFTAAETMTKAGAAFAVVHGSKDSWIFWDANGDGRVDNGVTLSAAALTRSQWSGPAGAVPVVVAVPPPAPVPAPPPPPADPALPTTTVELVKNLFGTAGNDWLAIRTADERAVEQANGGTDTVVAYVDYTLGDHLENLSLKGAATKGIGNALANQINGGTGDDLLDGQAGDDRLRGAEGNDNLFGGAGKDWLEGNAGNDRLDGGLGADVLLGGAGADTFSFVSGHTLATRASAEDRIGDFAPGDRIEVDGKLLDLAALPDLYVGQATYTTAFDAAEAIVKIGQSFAIVHGDKDSWLFWDANGDGNIDNGVTLSAAALTRSGWAGVDAIV